MKWLPSVIFFFFGAQVLILAQRNIVIDTSTYTVEQLVRDVLIQSECAEIENVSFIGKPGQVGYFSSGNDAIQMEEGIILSTGRVHDAIGPNSSTSTATDFVDIAHVGDNDLRRVANVSVNEMIDDAIIEFDFIPLDDEMEFEFVFASEEYCEYAGGASIFNDVFGFFLSGPGITGPYSNNGINLATSPGTNDNITVNNINQNLNYDFFIDNTPLNQPQALAVHYENCRLVTPRDGITSLLGQDGQSVTTLEYDGYTVTLKATSTVIPFQRYHLRIGVGDVLDGSWDSAVFLKAGSFKAGQPQANISLPDTLNCLTQSTVIDASNSSMGKSFSYHWTTFDGNIVNGAFGFTPTVDQAGTYQLIVSRTGANCNDTAFVEVVFDDEKPEIINATSDTLTCIQTSVEINIEIDDPSVYTFQVAYPSGTFSPIQNDTRFNSTHAGWHRLFAISANGCEDEYMHFVVIDTFAGDVNFDEYTKTCLEDELVVLPQFIDLGNTFTFRWESNNGNVTSSKDSLEIVVDQGGDYVLTVSNTYNGCNRNFNLEVLSNENPPLIYAGDDLQLDCSSDFVIPQAFIVAADGDEMIEWIALNGGSIEPGADALHPEISIPGTYVLQVIKNNGCLTLDTIIIIPAADAPKIELLHVDTLNCLIGTGIIDVTITGAFETVNWSTLDGVIETVSANNSSVLVSKEGTYMIKTINKDECEGILNVVVLHSGSPAVEAGDDQFIDCDGKAMLQAEQIIDATEIKYTWSGGPDPSFSVAHSSAVVSEPGIYTLTVFNDLTGCENTDNVEVLSAVDEIKYHLEFENCEFNEGSFYIDNAELMDVSTIFYNDIRYAAADQITIGASDILTIVKNDGCEQVVNFAYLLHSDLTVDIVDPGKVIAGEPFLLVSEINRRNDELISVEWNADIDLSCIDCLEQQLTIDRPLNIQLMISDIYGCTEEVSLVINPEIITRAFIPNAFSPNDDGINDKLEILTNKFISNIVSMEVYDRWGSRIFSVQNDKDFSLDSELFFWDGQLNADRHPAPSGIYVYSTILETTAGDHIHRSGNVLLLR